MDKKLIFAERRTFWTKKWWSSVGMHRLEQKYGKYIYLPLAVPKILPHNQEEFVKFYFDNAKTMGKLRPDATSDQWITPTYLTIDSASTRSYSLPENINYVPDLNIKFKSITEQILEYLPFKNVTFKLWSSFESQGWHRDISCMADIPSQFRIMLYDTNSAPTLYLKRDIPDQGPVDEIFKFMPYTDTNTFVWNNLRAVHGSKFTKGYTKILLIINEIDSEIDWNKYEMLLEKSIAKYKDYLFIDDIYTTKDYCVL